MIATTTVGLAKSTCLFVFFVVAASVAILRLCTKRNMSAESIICGAKSWFQPHIFGSFVVSCLAVTCSPFNAGLYHRVRRQSAVLIEPRVQFYTRN